MCAVLTDYNVNIASLGVARQQPGSPALSVIQTDQRVTKEAVGRLAALDGITNVRSVSFAPE